METLVRPHVIDMIRFDKTLAEASQKGIGQSSLNNMDPVKKKNAETTKSCLVENDKAKLITQNHGSYHQTMDGTHKLNIYCIYKEKA